MSRPTAAPHARAGAAPHAPHGSEGVGHAETEETLRLPHMPHMPHRVSASGGEKHAPGAMKKSLAALAERWEARTAARQAAASRPGEADPVANEAPSTRSPPPPPDTPDAWGMSDADRVAALARLEAAEPVAVAPAPPEPPPSPALPWWQMPYGAERGRAFADAKALRGACPICAGRRWWRRAGTDEAPTCATCHPPDHLAPEAVRMVTT